MVGAVNADQATELLALDLFNTGARQITLWDVEHCIHELRSHFPRVPLRTLSGGCDGASGSRFDVVRCWQKQARETRLRALR